MPTYRVYGVVVGSKYLGEYEADSAEEAEELAMNKAGVSLCHECSRECEDPGVESAYAEEVN